MLLIALWLVVILVVTLRGVITICFPMMPPAVLRLNASHPFDDFVKFAPVEPNTSAFGAVVDFDSLSLRQEQIYVTYWTSRVHYLLRIVSLKHLDSCY
jgi:hypothetical protein